MKVYREILWNTTTPSDTQHKIASQLGVKLRVDDTYLVAAARILDVVADAIGETPEHDSSDKQRELARKLDINIEADSRRVAWAKIKQTTQQLNYDANIDAVQNLQLKAGDVVTESRVVSTRAGEKVEFEIQGVISSIRWDGMVHFRGGNGRSAWAQNLSKSESNA